MESDVFETRLMLRQVICTVGEEAARMFYHPGRFMRKKAFPTTALRPRRTKGSVQLEECDSHRRRKQMLLPLMSHTSIRRVVDLLTEE